MRCCNKKGGKIRVTEDFQTSYKRAPVHSPIKPSKKGDQATKNISTETTAISRSRNGKPKQKARHSYDYNGGVQHPPESDLAKCSVVALTSNFLTNC
jgi:hypothetical protein